MIVMDTVGAKHMSLYGYHRRTTPNLEEIAKESTFYSRCYAPGNWTLSSHASLFTGLYPSEHLVDGSALTPHTLTLGKKLQHIVSIFNQSGYNTCCISCNGLVSPLYGLCRGFEIFIDYSGLAPIEDRLKLKNDNNIKELKRSMAEAPNLRESLQIFLHYVLCQKNLNLISHTFDYLKLALIRRLGLSRMQYSAPFTKRSFRTALKIIKNKISQSNSPFFIFLNLMEAHSLYNPPKKYRHFSKKSDSNKLLPFKLYDENNKSLIKLLPIWNDLYDDEILFLDYLIADFWQQLKVLNIFDNSIVIITSDHGDHFGEKGFYEHNFSLFNDLIWVPLIIRYPSWLKKSCTDNRLVSLTDLYSMLLDIIDSPMPRPLSSYSLLSSEKRASLSAMSLYNQEKKLALAAAFKKPKKWVNNLTVHDYAIIMDNNLKLLQNERNELFLYNLAKDRNEENDLSSSLDPQILQDLSFLINKDKHDTGYAALLETTRN